MDGPEADEGEGEECASDDARPLSWELGGSENDLGYDWKMVDGSRPVVMKAVFDASDRPGRWYGALELLEAHTIDWDYLARRGAAVAPQRILSLLLYASDEGVDVPSEARDVLIAAVTS